MRQHTSLLTAALASLRTAARTPRGELNAPIFPIPFPPDPLPLHPPPSASLALIRAASASMRGSAYASIRQHTSAYVSIRQHTSAYGLAQYAVRQHAPTSKRRVSCMRFSICQLMSAYVRLRQHWSAYLTEGGGRKDVFRACGSAAARGTRRAHTPVDIRQHTSAYVSIRQQQRAARITLTRLYMSLRRHTSAYVAYVSIRQHTSAYVARARFSVPAPQPQHTSAYVSIRQHTSAYLHLSIEPLAWQPECVCRGTYVSIREHT